jgi:transposase
MPQERSAGKPTTRRYSIEEKRAAVRMVRVLRAETGMTHGAVRRVADQLGYGVESVRSRVEQLPSTSARLTLSSARSHMELTSSDARSRDPVCLPRSRSAKLKVARHPRGGGSARTHRPSRPGVPWARSRACAGRGPGVP